MDITVILPLVKENLGIRSNIKDSTITMRVNGVIKELEDEKGLVLDSANPYHLEFIVDYATWRYKTNDSKDPIPRHLQYRLNNLFIHVGSANLNVDSIETVAALPDNPDANTVYILSTDSSKQMYINDVWTSVDMVNGSWVVV